MAFYCFRFPPDDEVRAFVSRHGVGTAASVEFLVGEFYDLLPSCARQVGFGDGLNTDDLIEEGQLGLYRAARIYDPFRSTSFPALAKKAITNAMLDCRRRVNARRRRERNFCDVFGQGDREEESFSPNVVDRDADDPLDTLIACEQQQKRADLVRRLLSVLSPQQRQLLALRLGTFDGVDWSYRKLAYHLGVPIGTIKSRLYVIRRTLEQHVRRRRGIAEHVF